MSRTPIPTDPRDLRRITFPVSVCPARTTARLFWLVALLVGLHVWIHVLHYRFVAIPWPMREVLDLDEEQSIGTWVSTLLLLLAGLTSLRCARVTSESSSGSSTWFWLGLGFALLSMDELVGFHESFNSVTSYSWAIPGGFLALTVGVACLRFLAELPRGDAVRLVAAGAVYVGGAVGVELATEPMAERDQLDTLAYSFTTALEEGMEMSGVVLYLRAASRTLVRAQSRDENERQREPARAA